MRRDAHPHMATHVQPHHSLPVHNLRGNERPHRKKRMAGTAAVSAVMAAIAQVEDAKRYLAKKLENAANELERQSIRVRTGDPYLSRPVAARMAAVEEALTILDAYQETVERLIKAGAA